MTSPLLEEARQGIVDAIGSFHEAWRHVDKCVRQMERFADVIAEAPRGFRSAEMRCWLRRRKCGKREHRSGRGSLLPG